MRVFRSLGRFTLVAGPVLVLLVFVLAAFLMWVLVTAPGSRWALTTAVEAAGGRVQAIEGSVWNGLRVGELDVDTPAVALRFEGLTLQADWRRLLERQLHVHTLRADTLWVDLKPADDTATEDAATEPFSGADLPVSVRVDALAVGELILSQHGRPLPYTIGGFSSAVSVGPERAQFWLRSLALSSDSLEAALEGEVQLHALQHPWPAAVDLDVEVQGLRPAAPVCFRGMLPTLPGGATPADPLAGVLAGLAADACPVTLHAAARGSLESVALTLSGSGQGMTLDADLHLEPLRAMPLRTAQLALVLPDGSSLKGHAGWDDTEGTGQGGEREGSPLPEADSVLVGELRAERLDAGGLAGGSIPPAVLGFDSTFRLEVDAAQTIEAGALHVEFHEGSEWNGLSLSGRADVALSLVGEGTRNAGAAVGDEDAQHAKERVHDATAPAANDASPAVRDAVASEAAALLPAVIHDLVVHRLNLDLRLGENRVHSEGSLGAPGSLLSLDVQAPRLAAFWPDLPGGLTVQGELSGSLVEHGLDLKGRYVPAGSSAGVLGSAPFAAALKAQGGWGGTPEGWRGRVTHLQADHAHLGVTLGAPVELGFVPAAMPPQWQWTVGPTEIGLSVNGRRMVSARHAGSRGGAGRWETEGRVERFIVSPQVLQQIGADFDIAALKRDERGGVKVRGARAADDWELAFALDWNLRFDGVPQGNVQLRRLSGDLMVPAASPFPLELERLDVDLTLARADPASSRLSAELNVVSKRMGRLAATATSAVRVTPEGGMVLNLADPKTVTVDASMSDLGWTSLLVGDAIDIGGALQAQIKATSRPDGTWATQGALRGMGLRVVMIDQGVRLLDGTLQARLDGERLVLEKLEFPARLRAEPKEWRTAEWVSTNPDAKGGWLRVTGDWNLFESQGVIDVALHRFPIVQRADRYAMMTGKLRLDAALPALNITGKLTADAGWFDLDMLGGIPTVDSDVVVIRPGQEAEPEVPLGISLDLEVDLGPRFYLTGYGLNSGLVGNMRVILREGKLSGLGALRTRGGAIEAYGQRLQLRRGAITFQGDITRPVLDIEALRTGLAVEAGVRVAGTARNPRIELVSYPAVSEIEKLSWLLLGHGPNDTGGDMALLFSVGTSFLSDGEPFYRRFGIDEVSLRSGEIGSVASVLPVESVVSGLDSGTSDIERRFINVSKRLTSGVTISLRQALSQTGTVARASYRLARGLTAEASVGSINGLALVYRWFSRPERPPTQQ